RSEVFPTCAKKSWVRRSLSALLCAGVRLASYPSPEPHLVWELLALGLSFLFTFSTDHVKSRLT
uniref:Uncharacterized protein n=1 Tax=Aegilops tauschii subsp. strangulata TaxID=200361 RepID=A0A453BLV9_AEGTS